MKTWHSVECKSTELDAKLNSLERASYTIFSVLRVTGGFTDNILVVFYEQA